MDSSNKIIRCGIFYVDTNEGIAYIVHDGETVYHLHPDMFTTKQDAIKACRAFVHGYNVSKNTQQQRIKELLRIK